MESNTKTGGEDLSIQITQEMRQAIELFLKKIEDAFKIQIVYACDTGSRSLGSAVNTSDFDINGFYIIPGQIKCKKVLSIYHVKNLIHPNDKFKEMYDMQIWNLEYWLENKTKKKLNSCDFWFHSPIVYRNIFPQIISSIKEKVSPPLSHFRGMMINNFKLCQKKLDSGVEVKKIMNTLIYAIQYFHARIFNDFPLFNIFEEIEFLLRNKDEMMNSLSLKEFGYLTDCFEYIKLAYEEKKVNKKSTTFELPSFFTSFIIFLSDIKSKDKIVKSLLITKI